ncbi:hypothetical protein KJ742_00710 [Patescibacteria group bacterium]|nr:hypothetical protein [Patescibacteria group bacterium]MBU1682443.1 hypothetical protein [Patescibacteria group bacterium]MBU1935704.1 hypothetical protein [Patescibacteria group bacterium]
MEIRKSILEKTSKLIASHIISRLGEETRNDIEAIIQETFKVYEALKITTPEDRNKILSYIKEEAIKIRQRVDKWSQ